MAVTTSDEVAELSPGPERGWSAAAPAARIGARPPRTLAGFFAGAAYLVAALLVYWPVQPFSTGAVVNCGCYDIAEQMWFLSWTPHAILHNLNPFFTSALSAPYGANLASNTTMPLLGLLASPITLTLGPVATFNVLIRLAFFTSALSMCLVLRHYSARWTVAFLGGLVYGFSPYMVAQGDLHLNLCFIPLLPLVVVAIDDLIVRPRHSARRAGLTLGALVTAQYFISSELLADFVVVAVIGLVVLAARYPRIAVERGRRLVVGLGWALAPFVVLAAYPIAYGLFGAQHLTPNPLMVNGNEQIQNDLVTPLVPTPAQLLAPAHWSAIGATLVGGVNENGGYLGIPLVALWLASSVWAVVRRRGLPALLSLLALVAFVISLGRTLVVDGHTTGITLPFSLANHLPLLEVEVPARYSVLVVLAVVITVSLALDALWSSLVPRAAAASLGRRLIRPEKLRLHNLDRAERRALIGTGALVVLVLAALVPIFPRLPIASKPVVIPTLFTTSAVDTIPSGTNVLVYPYPIEHNDFSMLWQVESGFRFGLVGGYVLTPLQLHPPAGGGQGGNNDPPTLDPPTVEILFEEAWEGPPAGVKPPPPVSWAILQFEQFMRRYHVSTVIDDPIGRYPQWVTEFFTVMWGAPVQVGGLDVWYDADTRPYSPGIRHHGRPIYYS